MAIVTVIVLALSSNVSAQGKVSYQDFHFVIKATEGPNSQAVPGGTLQFTGGEIQFQILYSLTRWEAGMF